MISIGNGEKCPFCDKVMRNLRIGGIDSVDHLKNEHPKEMLSKLFPKKKYGEVIK